MVVFTGCAYILIKAVTKTPPPVPPAPAAPASLETLAKGQAGLAQNYTTILEDIHAIRRSQNDLLTRVNLFTAPRVGEEARLRHLETTVDAQQAALNTQGEATHACCTELHNDIGHVKTVVIKGHKQFIQTETRIKKIENKLGIDADDIF